MSKSKMLVQISVAGVVILFVLTGVFIPDEIFQRATDEILYEENEENSNNEVAETVTYWRRALSSLDYTLALSAGLGTIITALLSFRIGHGKWSRMSRRLKEWIFKKELPVKVIMQPSSSAFPTDSKECIPGIDQFHEANDSCSAPADNDENRFECKQNSDNLDCASSAGDYDKTHEIDLKVEEIDEILNASKKCYDKSNRETSVGDEPKYETLEARLVAVEGSLMRDIDSRMRIFEQQLEEFMVKMRKGDEQKTDVLKALDSLSVVPEEKPVSEFKTIFDDYDVPEKPSETALEDVPMTFKNSVPSKRYSTSKSGGASAFSEQICDTNINFFDKESSTENLSTISDPVQGDSLSCRSTDAESEVQSECESTKKCSGIPTSSGQVQRKKFTTQSKNYVTNKSETKSDQQMQQKPPLRQRVSSPVTKNENSSQSNSLSRRGPPRSRQQMKAILQQTNEKLSQRKASRPTIKNE